MPIERDWNYKMNNETIKYYIMEIIKNKEFGGERPLFATHDLQLENVTIHTGESALKECSNIIAVNCRFEGKYPFWHTNGFIVKNCLFTEGARAALWYSQNLQMTDTVVEAPKMFREMNQVGKCTTSQCPGNPVALPQRGTEKCTDRQGRLSIHAQ